MAYCIMALQITFLLILWVTVLILGKEDKYTTKYDNFDVDTVINSPRLLKNYVNCVIEKGSCTPEGEELKRNIPDALQTDCSKCSEKQKQLTEKVLQYLMENELDYWKLLQNNIYYAVVH
ncbi:hypothetical protein RN001_001946 [Aquatica leii]|uniref:Uncharacterized protein n=1 Tax=Aquatica leii TaxID=1421715 RepID=A0AAN7SSR1_9COLE|nr:hypothetical protein RN001_001946 [Aquatica leii]